MVLGASKKAQQIKELATPPDSPSSVLGTHMVPKSSLLTVTCGMCMPAHTCTYSHESACTRTYGNTQM